MVMDSKQHREQHNHQAVWLGLADASSSNLQIKPNPVESKSGLKSNSNSGLINKRLHLQEGPIDLVIKASGRDDACDLAYRNMEARFEGLLSSLVEELPALRTNMSDLLAGLDSRRQASPFRGPVACRMYQACLQTLEHAEVEAEVTPMAAVAGAVADHVLAAAADIPGLTSLYVNNGGDIAFHLQAGEEFICGICDYESAMTACDAGSIGSARSAQIKIRHDNPVRGIASSGRLGRSFSLGIADSVTVLADNAALADVVATVLANQVDLPDHPAVQRISANELDPDTDLGDRMVVTDLAALTKQDIHTALQGGARCAEPLVQSGLIHAAYLSLRGEHTAVSSKQQLPVT